MRRQVSYASVRAGSIAVIVMLSRLRWKHSCKTGASIYVTGKGGVGKTTVAAAIGLAAAEAGRRTIVCEVAEQDRVSRAFRREGVTAETEVQLAENLWAITIDPTKALQEWLAKQLGGGAPLRMMTRSHAFQYFVAAAPGAQGADHDREGLGAGAALALGRAQPHLRPRGRRRARLRPRPGDADDAAHVRRDRARRARSAARAARSRSRGAAGGGAMPR